MTEREIIKGIMEEKGIRNADLAAALGQSQAATWDRLNGRASTFTVKKLNEILRFLGYELVIMPRGKAGRIDGAKVVGDSK